ncbi:MAG: NAD(P)/FAD-dependent oxidoreductase [Kofleriaceae bacterium]
MSDAVVIGSGPNGLTAAIQLARAGAQVTVLEARPTIGGGMRTGELTLPGFAHDLCSAAHPMGILSPVWRELELEAHGLRWCQGTASFAHPLDDQPAVIVQHSLDATIDELDRDDARAYRALIAPLLDDPHGLLADLMAPLRMPRHPLRMARFGLRGLRSAIGVAQRFRGPRARALLAGCAGHAILPLDRAVTAGLAMTFMMTAHVETWPVAAGGSQAIAEALASKLRSLGGVIETGVHVRSLAELPEARVFLFDTSPAQLAQIAGDVLPPRYVRRLQRFRYGPGVFKLDFALAGTIPWRDPRCHGASTVHLGGTLEQIAAAEAAVWNGDHPDQPYMIVCQQSELDPSRAPAGQHTGYAYCHVPPGSTVDLTTVLETQLERFAPGFRDLVLARHVTTPGDLERYNPNYLGGAIAGGVSDLAQLFARPVARWSPYTTPHPQILICSASTPPGGGVHGMCGFHAARVAERRLTRPIAKLR